MTHDIGIIPYAKYSLINRPTTALPIDIPTNISDNESMSNLACKMKLENSISYVLLVAFPAIFVVSLVGNFLVLLTITRNRSLHTVTNLFLLNLAITDLLLTVICMPPTWTGYLFECFFYGSLMCPIFSYMQPLSVAASAYTLVAIALERYKAICKPLQSQHWKTKSHVMAVILGVWIFSCIITIPSAVCSTLFEYKKGRFNCRDTFNNTDRQIYYFFLTIMLFVVPLFVMLSLYSSMILTLWQGIRLDEGPPSTRETGSDDEVQSLNELPGVPKRFWQKISRSMYEKPHKRSAVSIVSADDFKDFPSTSSTIVSSVSNHRTRFCQPTTTRKSWSLQKIAARSAKSGRKMTTTTANPPHQKLSSTLVGLHQVSLRSTHAERSLLAKKRVIRMLIMIVIEFFVCWTPLYGYLLYVSMTMYVNRYWHILFLHLAFLSSCTNPITYCFVNVKFRKAMLNAIGCRSGNITSEQKNNYKSTPAYTKHSTTVFSEPICRSKSVMLVTGGTTNITDPPRKITFSGLPTTKLPCSRSNHSKTSTPGAVQPTLMNGSNTNERVEDESGIDRTNETYRDGAVEGETII